MSEEVPEPESESESDLDMNEGYTSPLRTMLTEIHEVYQELVLVGFPRPIAAQIVAHMIQDAMMYRSIEEDDEDDTQLDNGSDDNNDNRGPE